MNIPDDIRAYLLVSVIPVIVAVLWFLSVVLCREWVKQGLREKGLTPIRVRWRPLASGKMRCRFNVVYSDVLGVVHRGRCWTYWHRRGIHLEPEDLAGYFADYL